MPPIWLSSSLPLFLIGDLASWVMGYRFLISAAGLASNSRFNFKALNLRIGICSIRSFPSISCCVHFKHQPPSLSSSSISKARYLHSDVDRDSAHKVFDEMPHKARQFEVTHFDRVLSFLKIPTVVNRITLVTFHCLALKIGALTHLPISTYLLLAYSRTGALSSSQAMFEEIPERDVISWNAMMTASVEHRCLDKALNLFLKMVEHRGGFNSTSLLIIISALTSINGLIQGRSVHGLGFKSGYLSDCSLCNALIDMYAKCGDLESSECMFGNMEFRDTFSWNSIVSGCLHGNDPLSCLQYFRDRTCYGEEGDSISLSCAISAAFSVGDFDFGRILHAFVSKIGLNSSPNSSVANSLVSFYFECGDSKAAEAVFQETIHKDIVSWNAMLQGYAKNGKFMQVFDLLHEMQCWKMDKVTLLTIASICADGSLFEEGRTVHGLILRRGMESDTSLVNCLMDFYGKCGNIEKAELLFNSMEEKDSISWNTMIASYSINGLSVSAQTLFREMLHRAALCSPATLLAVLPSCDCLGFGKSVHSWILKSGFCNNLLINSLMSMYINCGDLTTALLILQRDSDISDVSSWNTVITGSVQSGFFKEALETFGLMMVINTNPYTCFDPITLSGALSACGNLGLVHGGKLIHGVALKSSLGSDTHLQNALITMYGRFGDIRSARSVFNSVPNLNLCSWNCLVSTLCQNKDPLEALNLFRCLDLYPDEFTISGITSACTQLGSIWHGKQIHGFTFRHGFHHNSVICSALLDMYSNCGRLDLALRVFTKLDRKSITAWNSMISAFGYHSDGNKAVELFEFMWRNGTEPNSGTFTSLLSACSHTGFVNEGLRYYNEMKRSFGVEPVTEHNVCVVDMLGRSGQLREAYDFVKKVENGADSGVWGALLSCCCYHGDVELGREVAERLFELDPENSGYYVALSNMYVAAGLWSDAVGLRKVIEDKGLRKPPGYSLVEC